MKLATLARRLLATERALALGRKPVALPRVKLRIRKLREGTPQPSEGPSVPARLFVGRVVKPGPGVRILPQERFREEKGNLQRVPGSVSCEVEFWLQRTFTES